ncbi:tRNA1(Val) (adenine(37)-N6)-methyltransferase [Paenibacillus sp. y28]|uniref:tRNA1(Val) (adenine(37)-N6)-methyltransferase n=1 Tax=Paenibacillus sp. y28 TaxID=3129110 RepID=UPI003018C434
MTIRLSPEERLDDLLTHELKIVQSSEVFSFSLDAVLLARFCQVPARGKIMDLCSGNGVIPLLLSTRSKAQIESVEIQERLWDMAKRSVDYNGLQSQINVRHGDLNHIDLSMENGCYDLVTVNPPYLPVPNGDQNVNAHIAAARHEIHCTLEDVIRVSSRLVKPGGRVAMVHRPARLADIMLLMRKYRLEPKRIRFVHPRKAEEANMLLIEALRDGKPEIRLLPPLIVYEDNNEYCEELLQVYYGQTAELQTEKESGKGEQGA